MPILIQLRLLFLYLAALAIPHLPRHQKLATNTNLLFANLAVLRPAWQLEILVSGAPHLCDVAAVMLLLPQAGVSLVMLRGCSDVRLASDTPVSGSCPAWQSSDPSLAESCPRLDSDIFLSESGSYWCPTAARRGDVDFMARGLARTSLALDAKRVMLLCHPGARRGLAACPILGAFGVIASLILGIPCAPRSGVLKKKTKHPATGYVKSILALVKGSETKIKHSSEGDVKPILAPIKGTELKAREPCEGYFQRGWTMAIKKYKQVLNMTAPFRRIWELACRLILANTKWKYDPNTANPSWAARFICNVKHIFYTFKPPSPEAYTDVDVLNVDSAIHFGGGARQTISGRRLSPYMIHDNGIGSWVHMDYTFESQCLVWLVAENV
ncbi:hypothetical protein B0H19DRAFT_1083177 [Mycena capillaripes]|nr:hypothetical protein B0H19DRAFT_1083177 [Mycena capillaripes]